MRFMPQTLFSRMVLILLGGLLTAQLLSAAIHLRERSKLLFRANAMQAAQRIADRVGTLDALGANERLAMLHALDAQDLRLALAAQAAPRGSALDASMADFEKFLRGHFPAGRMIDVSTGKAAPRRVPAHNLEWQTSNTIGQGHPPPAIAVTVQVRLHGGEWAIFDLMLPQKTAVLPYPLLANLFILLAAVLVLSLFAVRLATRPLLVLAEAAEELGKDIHRPPLAELGSAEVRRAARAFNTMQMRLVNFIQDRTRLLAAMSHDLKTPITRLRLRAELLDDEELKAKFDHDLQEMESMVSATLDFMRDSNSREAIQPVDVMALLESIQADGAEMGQKIGIRGTAVHPYPVAPTALKRCLVNLVDNAVKYGGQADIIVSDSEERLEIRILDHGPGIPEAQLERVFEPFVRLEESRSRDTGGTGLGLGIARNIVRTHGGKLVLRNAAGGLEALVSLPRLK